MRGLMKRIAAALAALRSTVAEVALVAVRGVDGVISWTWRHVASGVTAPVPHEHYELDLPEPQAPATDQQTLEAGLRLVGDQVVRAAGEMLRYGDVRSGDVALDVATWVRSLSRDDLRVLADADTLAAGRHVAGVKPLLDIVGYPIRGVDPSGDADRVAKHRRLREERLADERAQVAATRQRLDQERERDWTVQPDAPALVPNY